MYQVSHVVILVMSVWVCLSNQQAHPPGVPPSQYQQVHPQGVPANQHQQAPPPGVPSNQQQQPPPPGVPPSQYQQVHHQGVPANQHHPHDQMPQQQQQQIYPEGHGPPSQGGHQGGFGNQPHDAEHIKEHLKEIVDKPKEEMTDEELEFHYFKLHDYDGNNKLDGTEIIKAVTHFHEDDETNKEKANETKVISDDEIANIIDMVLNEHDLNEDGFIEYVEYVTAQRKAKDNRL